MPFEGPMGEPGDAQFLTRKIKNIFGHSFIFIIKNKPHCTIFRWSTANAF